MIDPFAMFQFFVCVGGIVGCSANDCPVEPGPLRWVCRCKAIVEHIAMECERIYKCDE